MPRQVAAATPTPPGPLHAQRALLHPLWLGSLAVLALNDHVLKGAGLVPELVTGKLSDIAGMIVAPAVLATALRVRTLGGWWRAHAAVGLVFAAIKLSPAVAAAWSALMGGFGFAWTIVCDPTDVLVAAPALVLGATVLAGALSMPAVRLARRSAEAGAAGLGLLCSVATSQPSPEPEPWTEEWLPEIFADVWLHNGTGTSQVIRIRTLRDSVQLDCDAVAADPARLLPMSLFGEVQSWTLPANANLGVIDPELGSTACRVALVDADAFAPVVLFWELDAPSARWVPGAGNDGGSGGIELVLDVDDEGHYETDGGFLYRGGESSEPVGECAAQDDAFRVDWGDSVPQGVFRIAALTPGVDGCTAIDLDQGESTATHRMYLCTPAVTPPFAPGDDVSVRMEYGVQSESVVIQRELAPTHRVVVSRGASAPVISGLQIAMSPLYGCDLAVDACGTAARASNVVLGGGSYSAAQAVAGGPPVELTADDGTRVTVAVAHAQSRAVVDTDCAAGPMALGDDLELVVVVEAPSE